MYDSEHEDEIVDEFTNELDCLKYVKKDLKELTLYFLYVSTDRKLLHVKNKKTQLQIPNSILKSQLSSIIKENNKYNNKLHKLVYLLKYNFNMDEKDLKNMENYCFLDTIDVLDDISFHPTVEIMSDINSLYFVYLDVGNKRKTRKNIVSLKKTAKN